MEQIPAARGRAGDRFGAHRALIAAATGLAVAEAALLVALAPAARTLAPQVTALPSLAAFHDLRWLYSSQVSWPGFLAILAGALLARAAASTLLARLAWPAGVPAPPLAATARAAAGVTVVACVLMSPLVSLSLGVAILPFSWPFLAMLPALLVIGLPLSHAGTGGAWWRILPPPCAVGWLLAEFAVLSAVAAVAGALPLPWALPLAGLGGLVNARAWYGVAAAAARPRARSRLTALFPPGSWARAGRGPGRLGRGVPAAPLAVALAVAVVITSTRLVFLLGTPGGGHPHRARAVTAVAAGAGLAPPGPVAPSRPRSHHPVLEVLGFGSTCCGHLALAAALPRAVVQQFSYRGLSGTGRPLPYGRGASDLHLAVLGDRIAAQVWRLHDRTGQRVDIVAESEGTLGMYAMLARHPRAPVGSVVLASPIVAPGQGRYGAAAGPGVVTGGELNAVVGFIGRLSPFGAAGAQRLLDSVNRVGARFAAQAAARRIRVMEIVPLADAVTLPACRLPRDLLVVPAFHGELLGDPLALRMVHRFLIHRRVRAAGGLRVTAEIMAAAASAWRLPEPESPSPPCRP